MFFWSITFERIENYSFLCWTFFRSTRLLASAHNTRTGIDRTYGLRSRTSYVDVYPEWLTNVTCNVSKEIRRGIANRIDFSPTTPLLWSIKSLFALWTAAVKRDIIMTISVHTDIRSGMIAFDVAFTLKPIQ